MLRSLQAVVVIVEGEGALIDLSRTPGPTGLHTTSGMGGLHEAGVGPITCTAEEGGPTGVTAGASNIRWTERGAERRCYDKGQQEGQ